MVIHQNLAHQRVLYESILKNITIREAISQQLLFPLRLNFTSQDVEVLKNIQEQLEHTGFGFSAFEKETIENYFQLTNKVLIEEAKLGVNLKAKNYVKALNDYFDSFHICYTIKANSNPHLIKILKTENDSGSEERSYE